MKKKTLFREGKDPRGKDDPKKFVKVCPKCGSTNIALPNMQPTDLNELPAQFGSARMLGARCKDCGFFSYVFPEFSQERVKEVQEEIRKKKH